MRGKGVLEKIDKEIIEVLVDNACNIERSEFGVRS